MTDKIVTKLLLASTILAAVALAAGYALRGLWAGLAMALAIGLFWLVGQRQGWERVPSVALALLSVATAVGLLLGVGGVWVLTGAAAGLVAWDLDRFSRRVAAAGRVENQHELERRHLKRLLIVGGISLPVSAAALSIRIELNFGIAVLLAVMAILSLNQAIRLLKREGE